MSCDLKAALYTFLQSKTLLTDIIGTDLFPDVAPESTALPYVTFETMSEDPATESTKESTLNHVHIAFTIYASNSIVRQSIRDAFRNILEGRNNYPLTDGSSTIYTESWLLNRQDRYEPAPDGTELGTFVTVLDYVFAYNDVSPTLP